MPPVNFFNFKNFKKKVKIPNIAYFLLRNVNARGYYKNPPEHGFNQSKFFSNEHGL